MHRISAISRAGDSAASCSVRRALSDETRCCEVSRCRAASARDVTAASVLMDHRARISPIYTCPRTHAQRAGTMPPSCESSPHILSPPPPQRGGRRQQPRGPLRQPLLLRRRLRRAEGVHPGGGDARVDPGAQRRPAPVLGEEPPQGVLQNPPGPGARLLRPIISLFSSRLASRRGPRRASPVLPPVAGRKRSSRPARPLRTDPRIPGPTD